MRTILNLIILCLLIFNVVETPQVDIIMVGNCIHHFEVKFGERTAYFTPNVPFCRVSPT